jgi:hypothetical protein
VEVVHLPGLEVTPQLSTLTSGELLHARYRFSGLLRLVGGSHLSGTPELQRASTHLCTRISIEPTSTAGLHSDLRKFVNLRL